MTSPVAAHAAIQAEPPDIAVALLAACVEQQFGLVGEFRPLVSERDQNFRLATAGGDEYVVKVTSLAEPRIVSEFQIAALLHLEQSDVTMPRVVRTRDGKFSGTVRDGEHVFKLRLVNYLPGVQMDSVPVTPGLAHEFGAALARLDAELAPFSHVGDQPELLWDLQRALQLRGLLQHIGEHETRRSVELALDDFESAVVPALDKLRTQVIHGDANPGNVLIDPVTRLVAGFIDVGDMVRAPLVFEAAIASSYLRAEDAEPLALIVPFVAGYDAVLPLEELEKSLLFDLVRARLATTITLLFWRLGARHNDDPYRQKTLCEEADAMRFLAALDAYGRDGFAAHVASAAKR